MSRPVVTIIGMCPNTTAPLRRPGLELTGTVGRRLAWMLGWTWTAYLADTRRLNVLAAQPVGPWPRAEAAARAELMGSGIDGCVLLLGRRVADAFGLPWDPARLPIWFSVDRLPRSSGVLVLPHPSGRCRWWNVPENRVAACRRARELVRL